MVDLLATEETDIKEDGPFENRPIILKDILIKE